MPSYNRDLFRRDGFVVLRNLIPAEDLDSMREAHEKLLDH